MLRHGQYYRTRRQPSDRSAQRQLWLLDQYRSRYESRLFPASFTRPFWGKIHTHSIRRFISLTTQWISASVVLKLVIHARTTGVSPIRASDIHAIWRWWRAARNLAGTSPSRVKQTSGNGVELTMRQPDALNASRSTCPIQVWCSIISAYPDSPCCASDKKSFKPINRRDHCADVVYGSKTGPTFFPGI